MARYLVGIDLGTTNSALAYIRQDAKTRGTAPPVEPFKIPQLVDVGQVAERPLLPSFIYLPGPHDLPPDALSLPWNPHIRAAVGEFARNQGSRVPGRLIASAKSWLCHPGVDRVAPLLPWSAPPDVTRVSPVIASSLVLRHLVGSWNHHKARDNPDDRLEKQVIVLTVPASFDDVARTLTVQAAQEAGLENVTLLEEPQAAFYCWLAMHESKEVARLKPGSLCLVVDVGGGTSDFSLIRAIEHHGELAFVREAVGDHLLLGGDNMDLALAKKIEAKLRGAPRLDAVQYGMLTQSCRLAKENLLTNPSAGAQSITVFGRGRQVIGGSLHATLSHADVVETVIDGFFPFVSREAAVVRGPRTGLHEMGLPYVADPAITTHLAAFLNRKSDNGSGGSLAGRPDAILFNGGVFQPEVIRHRVVEVMRRWYDTAEHPWQPLVLTNPSLDLAVAWGAAQYAWLKQTGGRRIGGGLARSYFIAVESDDEATSTVVGSAEDALTVVCVVPQGLEEGREIALSRPELELALGQPVIFPLYTSTVRAGDRAGDVFRIHPDQLLRLPPLCTILKGGKRSGTRRIPIRLAARCTEIGTLELFCVSQLGDSRWRLEFNTREIVPVDGKASAADVSCDTSTEARPTDVWPEDQVQVALRLIGVCYSHPDASPSPKELTPRLEEALESPRHRWPAGLCRRLWDALRDVAEHRDCSPAHLGRWRHLVGFVLRPGFGDPLDKVRVEQLWKLMHGPKHGSGKAQTTTLRTTEGGADLWIMWRRVAGGLASQLQNSLYDRLRPVLLPGKGKSAAKPGPNELAEMWRAAASLERIAPGNKELLGEVLLKSLRRGPTPTYGFWSLTRLGARALFYGPLNAVVHPEVAQRWIDAIGDFKPTNTSERLSWAFCLSQLARRTGQRALDVDEAHQQIVLDRLMGSAVPAAWITGVREASDFAIEEQNHMFGEALPIGLRLIGERA